MLVYTLSSIISSLLDIFNNGSEKDLLSVYYLVLGVE
jgi:hypothetical protein